MSVPLGPTPHPLATFEKTDLPNPGDLLDFIRNLSKNLDDNSPSSVTEDERLQWTQFWNSICKELLNTFPTIRERPWSTNHEKIRLLEVCTELLCRAPNRNTVVFSEDEKLAQAIVVQMINFMNILDAWIDIPEEETNNDYPTPEELRSKVKDACLAVLQALARGLCVGKSGSQGWLLLRKIAIECQALCQDLLSPFPEISLDVVMFSTPRLRFGQSQNLETSDNLVIRVEDIASLPLLVTALIELLVEVMSPILPSVWFLQDVVRLVLETARHAFEFLISPLCITTDTKRARAITRLVSSVISGKQSMTGYEHMIEALRFQLLLSRLNDGPSESWNKSDIALKKTFLVPLAVKPTRSDIRAIVRALCDENWGDMGHNIRHLAKSYLQLAIQASNGDSVRFVVAELSKLERVVEYTELLHLAEHRLNDLSSLAPGSPTKQQPPSQQRSRRAHIRDAVQAIVNPDELAWMDDDESMNDTQYISRALTEVDARSERPLQDSSSQGRLALARDLSRLPCALAHGPDPSCSSPASRIGINSLTTCLRLASHIMKGPEADVTVSVRKAVYVALSKGIRHHSSGFGGGLLEKTARFTVHGMKDPDRNARLQAGRCFAALINLHQCIGGDTSARTEPLVSMLGTICKDRDEQFKEGAILTAGLIGRTATGDVLYQVLHFLVALLNHQNPFLKGSAYTQISSIAVHQQKTPHALFSPYMDRIAPFVVSRICSQPSILVEFCKILGTNEEHFMRASLKYTLPHIVAACDKTTLDALAEHTGQTTYRMLFLRQEMILAHALQLPKPGQAEEVLRFIVAIYRDASGGSEIELQAVLTSCVVDLVAELVVAMGDERPGVAQGVSNALAKVENIVPLPKQSQKATSNKGTHLYLKHHMLGIIAFLHEVIQDGRGKLTVEAKRQILRALGAFITEIGAAISSAAPQIMATMQMMLAVEPLSEVTLKTWNIFVRTLDDKDLGSHVGTTSAALVAHWPSFSLDAKDTAKSCIEFIVFDKAEGLGSSLDEVVDLSAVPELADANLRLQDLRRDWTPEYRLTMILDRARNDNIIVVSQALMELKVFMLSDGEDYIRSLTFGDVFDPAAAQILAVLTQAACREYEGSETLRDLAFVCLGVLGAIDPDRFELAINDTRMIMTSNFADEEESMTFATHLISDVLVGAFRSSGDMMYQGQLAFAIQELLAFCKFTPSLVNPMSGGPVPLKVRSRWDKLPKHIIETATPLLSSKYNLPILKRPELHHPIYPNLSTYREWIQSWTSDLIHKVSQDRAQKIFSNFIAIVRNKDVGVAHHLLPHLILHVLISGNEEYAQDIRMELLSVLEDQLDPNSMSTIDKKELSAQTVFTLMDHLNKWVRVMRQDIKRSERKTRTSHSTGEAEEQLLRVDSILSSIDQNLMAKAALQCKAHARALMCFEQQILALQSSGTQAQDSLPGYYERLHEIYANLDLPDGMEGVSTLILSPSLEHQIRQHESTGRWTSAQSCWEVRLQHSPNDLKSHLGLLRCLRSLGHYDTMRTHVKGVLTTNPEWGPELVGYQVESGWMVGDWDEVQVLVEKTSAESAPVLLARVLLAMRASDEDAISNSLSAARRSLGAPIPAAGINAHRRAYDALVDLHLVHELGTIHNSVMRSMDAGQNVRPQLNLLQERLNARLDSTLPSFRIREPILSIRRAAFGLRSPNNRRFQELVGETWLMSAKLARKAGYWQTAYSAMLQARQSNTPFTYVESAKLVKASGESLRALQELENSIRVADKEKQAGVIDLTAEAQNNRADRIKAKAMALRARWMQDSDRYEPPNIIHAFQHASDLWKTWESGLFHLGQFQDTCLKKHVPNEAIARTLKMNVVIVKCFAKAARYGSKYIYQTIPRLLTLWLDMGDNAEVNKTEAFQLINQEVSKALKTVPMYKWYTAFPQIVSRVGHGNGVVYSVLEKIISGVIQEYPKQALWLFSSVVKSTKTNRSERGRQILDKLKSHTKNDVPKLILASLAMTAELLNLCDFQVQDERKPLSMKKNFPKLHRLLPSPLIIPLQESLTASVPPTSSSDSTHQPFPLNAPTFHKFHDEIEVMRSLARPRKITIHGDNGQVYMFLGKPKDDLRKDARLMDFNAIINKLLRSNSESRRRQLHIRTYGVVTLNEECGFIQWVPNTIPIRPVLLRYYDARGVRSWSNEMGNIFSKIKSAKDREAAKLFTDHILTMFPPVFHEWFIETFPEPTAWLSSRLTYSRTAAVMSMVGFILGLGDRHCENILLDTNTGDVVHVDFNCLFEKGKTLETPERVPFRLTQNMVDGLGIIGVEGIFRIACEVTMQLLRDNKDSLMSVLDAFVHDPLVEWEDEKRKIEREAQRRNTVRSSVDLRKLAKNALNPIERKLSGMWSNNDGSAKEFSTSSLVQVLIHEATDNSNLSKMYPGWAPWH